MNRFLSILSAVVVFSGFTARGYSNDTPMPPETISLFARLVEAGSFAKFEELLNDDNKIGPLLEALHDLADLTPNELKVLDQEFGLDKLAAIPFPYLESKDPEVRITLVAAAVMSCNADLLKFLKKSKVRFSDRKHRPVMVDQDDSMRHECGGGEDVYRFLRPTIYLKIQLSDLKAELKETPLGSASRGDIERDIERCTATLKLY